MTKTQENTLSMFAATERVLQENRDTWINMAGFVTVHDKFMATWTIIDPDAQKQILGTKPITIEKAKERAELIRQLLLISGNTSVYASQRDKSALKQEMAIYATSLERMRDNLLLVTANMVHERAMEVIDQLADYGVTTEVLINFRSVIDSFKVNAGAPRHTTGNKKTATTNIKENLAICLAQLNDLDKLVENFRREAPVFVSNYINARKIVDLGHRKAAPKENIKLLPPPAAQ